MNCHNTHYFDDGKKIKLRIPGCWGAVIYGDDHCTCHKNTKEKESQLEIEVKKLRSELAHLKKNICDNRNPTP